MYIILDTNIWISNLGLTTKTSAALLFFIKQKNATLVIPEVIKREVEFQIQKKIETLCEQISKNHRELLSIFGRLPEVVLPNDRQIQEYIASLFNKIGCKTMEIPFSIESARSSLERVITHTPPSSKNQQFKDGVVWADCLNLLDRDDVTLVTKDGDFYEKFQGKQVLANILQQETQNKPHTFHIFKSLEDLLNEIKAPVDIDQLELAREYMNKTEIQNFLNEYGLTISSEPKVKHSTFITENTDLLEIYCTIQFDCNGVIDGEAIQTILELKGKCIYESSTKKFSTFTSDEHSLTDTSANKIARIVFASLGSIVLGHREASHIVRYEI